MIPKDQISDCDRDLLSLANKLLSQFSIPIKVRSVEDVGATVFVTLYEGLYGDQLPGIIRHPVTIEDEIHNCQTVIDSLSKDVLHISLSHIRGAKIVSHCRENISNLLEIFAGLSDYIFTRIDSDAASSDNEDVRYVQAENNVNKGYTGSNGYGVGNVSGVEDPDILSRDIIDDFLERELSLKKSKERISLSPNTKKTAEYINSQIYNSGTRTPDLDSTTELIREGEKWEEKLRDNIKRVADNRSPTEFDKIGQRRSPSKSKSPKEAKTKSSQIRQAGTNYERSKTGLNQGLVPSNSDTDIHHTFTHHLYHYYNPTQVDSSNAISSSLSAVGSSVAVPKVDVPPAKLPSTKGKGQLTKPVTKNSKPPQAKSKNTRNTESNMSASLPLKLNPQPAPTSRMRATIATPTEFDSRHFRPVSRQSRESPLPVDMLAAKGLAASYDNLQNLVESTATLAKTAVKTSPVRLRAERDISHILSSPGRRPVESRSLIAEDDIARDINKPRTTKQSREIRSTRDANMSNNTSKDSTRRKVSFHHDRSSTDSGSPYRQQILKGAPNVSLDMKRRGERLCNQDTLKHGGKYGSYTDMGYLSDRELDSEIGSDRFLQQRFNEIVDDVLSVESDKNYTTKSKKKPNEKERQVHFEKTLAKTGKNALAITRHQLKKETKKATTASDYLKKVYAEDYDDYLEDAECDLKITKDKVKELDKEYKKKTTKKFRKPSVSSKKKGPGAVKLPLSKPVSSKVRKCSSSCSGILPRKSMLTVHDEEELLPVLLEEFPFLHMTQQTWHELWRRGLSQIENITRAHQESKRKKSKSQAQMEEAVKRHEVLTRLVKKQVESMKRVREAKEQKKQQIQLKNKLHEKRQQSARARKYYNEYSVRARSKLLRRRTKEEMIFKNLFKDGLAIQKERIQEIRRYAREQREKQCKQRQDELDSMENYYHDQFEMLAAKVASEREELLIREKAQQKVLGDMKKELRKKMEKEIMMYQEQLFRDDDDAYFRQLDADRMRKDLHLAKYQARV